MRWKGNSKPHPFANCAKECGTRQEEQTLSFHLSAGSPQQGVVRPQDRGHSSEKVRLLGVYPGCSFCQFSMLCSRSAARRRTTVRPWSFKRKTVPVDGLSRRWITPLIVASGVGLDGVEILRTSYSGSRGGAGERFPETNSRALEPSGSTLGGCRYSGSLFSTGCL